jgi:hypothetical protein
MRATRTALVVWNRAVALQLLGLAWPPKVSNSSIVRGGGLLNQGADTNGATPRSSCPRQRAGWLPDVMVDLACTKLLGANLIL